MESGYNSHYAVTLSNGEPPKTPQEHNIYDELVIPQEYVTTTKILISKTCRAQIAPFAVLKIDSSNLKHMQDKFSTSSRRIVQKSKGSLFENSFDSELVPLSTSMFDGDIELVPLSTRSETM